MDKELLEAPTNTAAEWSVIASMLTNPAVIGEVIGVPIEEKDFSLPDTRALYRTTVERYYAGQPVDALIVGELAREELASCWQAEPQSIGQLLVRRTRDAMVEGGTIGEHASIVKRLSVSRQLQDACYAALNAINDGKLTPAEVGDQLSGNALQITSGSVRRTELLDWMEVGTQYVKQLRRVMEAQEKGQEIGVYTGMPFFDDWTSGIAPGELCFLAGEPGIGKALALDTPIATRGGWTTMGAIGVGETVFDWNGARCRVVAVSAVQLDRECFRVVFDDGQSVIADAEHLWVTTDRKERKAGERYGRARTTVEIAGSLLRVDGGFNHRIENPAALELPDWPVTVDPWVLGFWLGDGDTARGRVTVGDEDCEEVAGLMRSAGYYVVLQARVEGRAQAFSPVGLGDQLVTLGLLGDKRIPREYQRASAAQRGALLAGLVDSDGSVRADGGVEISTMHQGLSSDVCELLASLGLKFSCRRSRATLDGRFAGWRYRITFMPFGPVARLSRKQRGCPTRDLHSGRFIRAVVRVPSVPVRCIKVDSVSHTFLAGAAMIPTHNTALGWAAGLGFAGRQMARVLEPGEQRIGTMFASLEMNLHGSTQRIVSSLTGIDGVALREGKITRQQYAQVLREWKNREHLPIRFNFASNFRLSQLRALIAEGIRKANVGFVIIDHFRMLDTDRVYQNPNSEDEAKVRFLKEQIAEDLGVAVMCLAHTIKVGRGSGAPGESPKPRLSDLRGSGQIAAHADFVAFLWSPAKHMSEEARFELDADPNDMELSWEKNRWGGSSTAKLRFEAKTMKVLPR